MSPGNGRGRPGKGDLQTPTTKSSSSVPRHAHTYTLDDLIAAEMAGRAHPDLDLINRLAEIRLYELAHERTVEMLGLARSEAMRKGPAWTALIMDAAEEPWSA